MTKHTPGPWRADVGCYTVRADALPLSAATGLDSGAVAVAVQSIHDARLIAAAPELLAALEGVESHNAALKPEYKLSESLMRQVRAAIAKATE